MDKITTHIQPNRNLEPSKTKKTVKVLTQAMTSVNKLTTL